MSQDSDSVFAQINFTFTDENENDRDYIIVEFKSAEWEPNEVEFWLYSV